MLFYNGWNDTDGKDEIISFDETISYTLENDASEFWDNWIGTHFPVYSSSGTRISNLIDLSSIKVCTGSKISWVATVPVNTTLIVETSLDGGQNYTQVTNGGSIPGITPGMDLTGKSLVIKQTFYSSDNLNTPRLDGLQLEFNRGFNFINEGDVSVKPIIEITKYGNGDVSIINLSNNKEFKFTNLSNNEIITVYNEEEIIESNLGLNRYSNFNDNYLDLPIGNTTLRVIGSCKIILKWQYKKL